MQRLLTLFFAALVVAAVVIPYTSLAQEQEPAETQAQRIEQLERRVEELEQKLQQALEALDRQPEIGQPPGPEAAVEELPDEPQKEETKAVHAKQPKLDIGGALRFNYALSDFDDDSEARGGDLEFDIFRIDVDGEYENVIISAQYRWWSYMDAIHHGWLGYDFTDQLRIQAGVTRVPFGLLPFASHNYWFGVPYYIGFEDDYDMGIKAVYDSSPWNLQLAFFKNGEWGDPSKLERYSYDVVKDSSNFPGQDNEETNQINARLAYTFEHNSLGSVEAGMSGEYGQLYNSTTDNSGDRWAAAVHLNGFYGPFNVMLEAARYEFNPENPEGVADDQILMGAFAEAAPVAAEGTFYVANVSYDVPVAWGPISLLTFYNDYSILVKDEDDFNDSQINTLGCLVTAGPVYTYIDFISGKNAQFLGGGTEPFGAADDSDDEWHSRFNINVGYYF